MKNEISLTISKKMQRQVYPGIWKFYQVFFVAPNGNSLCYWCFNPAGISNGVVLEFMGHINYLLSQLLTHQNSSINHITEVLFRQKKSWWSNFPSQLFSNSPTNSSPQLKHHTHIYPVQKIASLQKPLKKLPPYCNTHTPHHTQPAELSCRIKGIMPSFLGFFAWNLNRRQPFREGRWIFFRAACFTYKKSLLLPVCFFLMEIYIMSWSKPPMISCSTCESFGILLPFLPWRWKWKMAKIAKVMSIGRTRFSLPSWWEER